MTGRPPTLSQRFPDLLAHAEVAVQRGWVPLVGRLLEAIEGLPEADREGLRIVQVKEKMGELRVNYYGRGPALRGLIDAATEESLRTCDRCGGPGRLRCLAGTYATLCDTHAEEEDV